MKAFPRFYPIAPSAYMLCRLVNAGAKLVQLRIKDRDMKEVRDEIRASQLVCDTMGAQLVLNDYWELAIDEGCTYVHLGQSDLETADLDALRRNDVKLGLSTHSAQELEKALAARPDYIALGPIYPTTLKVMPFAPQGAEMLGKWKKQIGKTPLVAIGGITLARTPLCFDAGADCVAVVNDVVNAPSPEQQVEAYLALTDIDE